MLVAECHNGTHIRVLITFIRALSDRALYMRTLLPRYKRFVHSPSHYHISAKRFGPVSDTYVATLTTPFWCALLYGVREHVHMMQFFCTVVRGWLKPQACGCLSHSHRLKRRFVVAVCHELFSNGWLQQTRISMLLCVPRSCAAVVSIEPLTVV